MSIAAFAAVCFIVATLAFAWGGAPFEAVVSLVAAMAYVAIALQQRRWRRSEGKGGKDASIATMTPRFVDWAITTPLLLFLLLRGAVPPGQLAFIMGLDVLMVLAGYEALRKSADPGAHAAAFAYFTVGCLLFVPIGVLLLSKAPTVAGVLTAVLWLLYPIVFYARFVARTPTLDARAFAGIVAALDLTAKVGVGILLARARA